MKEETGIVGLAATPGCMKLEQASGSAGRPDLVALVKAALWLYCPVLLVYCFVFTLYRVDAAACPWLDREFAAITPGMTEAEVVAIMGESWSASTVLAPDLVGEVKRLHWPLNHYTVCHVEFDVAGRVFAKDRSGDVGPRHPTLYRLGEWFYFNVTKPTEESFKVLFG